MAKGEGHGGKDKQEEHEGKREGLGVGWDGWAQVKCRQRMGKKRDEKGSKPLNTLKKTKSLWALLKEFGGHGGTPIIEVIKAKAAISHVRNVAIIRPSGFL